MPKTTSNTKKSTTTTKKTTSTTKKTTSTTKKTPAKATTSSSRTTKGISSKKIPSKTMTQKARLTKRISQQTERETSNTSLSSEIKNNKSNRLIPIWVRVFFGCSLFLFCIALYKAILLPKIIQKDTPTSTTAITNETITPTLSPVEGTPVDTTIAPTTWPAFIRQFYQVFSQKDIETLRSLMDTPLQKSEDMRRFFSSYKITPFIDNIENNKLQPENIQLLNTSASGVEEYQYELNYHLVPNGQDFKETWIVRVKYTESWPKLASIHCETSRCSYNPFFRPESYNLIK